MPNFRRWIFLDSFLIHWLSHRNVPHQNIRRFSIFYGRHQKTLLDPSIAESAAQPQSNSSEIEQSPYDANNPFLATLKVNRELLRSGARSCRHIEFDINGSNMEYEAGDHIGIYPTNDSELVEKLGKLCDANLNAKLDDSKLGSFRTALTHHIEVTAVPQLHFLKALTEYCTDESDRKFLELISSATRDGKDLYQSWVMDAQRNIVHVLEDIKSCRPSIEFVCKMLPKLQPRYYSISSSSRLHPNVVHMTVVLVEYETKTGRINKGVATAFLAKKNPGVATCDAPLVPVFIRKSQFHLPKDVQTPIIMIGTGTGLAPFLGFIQERNHCRETGESVGQSTLYFGARKRTEDFIYEQVSILFLAGFPSCYGNLFSFFPLLKNPIGIEWLCDEWDFKVAHDILARSTGKNVCDTFNGRRRRFDLACD